MNTSQFTISTRSKLDDALTKALEPGEKLIWQGIPKQGLQLGKRDIFLIPFSVLWAGFSFFWEGNAVSGHTPIFFQLWGLPFVAMGCYILFGRFFHDAWRRARTVYVLTNERILIFASGSRKSLELAAIGEMQIDVRKDGFGSIGFGTEPSIFMRRDFGAWSGKPAAPTFEMIEGAEEVFARVRLAQKEAKSRAN